MYTYIKCYNKRLKWLNSPNYCELIKMYDLLAEKLKVIVNIASVFGKKLFFFGRELKIWV